jgi:hypothetical protein
MPATSNFIIEIEHKQSFKNQNPSVEFQIYQFSTKASTLLLSMIHSQISALMLCPESYYEQENALPFLMLDQQDQNTANNLYFETSHLLDILKSAEDIAAACHGNLPAMLEPTPIGPSARMVDNMSQWPSHENFNNQNKLGQETGHYSTISLGCDAAMVDNQTAPTTDSGTWTWENHSSKNSGIIMETHRETILSFRHSSPFSHCGNDYSDPDDPRHHRAGMDDFRRSDVFMVEQYDPSLHNTHQSSLPSSSTSLQRLNPPSNRTEAAKQSSVPATSPHTFRHYQTCQWRKRFCEFLEFVQLHGHHLVPHSYPPNQKLAQWVKRQRHQHKKKAMGRHSTLSDEREQLVMDAGFVFDSHKEVWLRRFQTLQAFHAVHGHCSIPSSLYEDAAMNVWTKHQRRQYLLFKRLGPEKSMMTEERIHMLDSIGFDWNPRKKVKNLNK